MTISILGFGTIGAGVYELAKKAGLDVRHILDLRPVPEGLEATMEDILRDESVDLVVETMGGLHPAFEFALSALEAGKHLVTANKFLVSEYGDRLAQAAREHGVSFRFNAACGGGIPFLSNLLDAAKIDRITSCGGILNGTTNFILDRMERFGESYGAALSQAQALGYAEKDPSADVDGLDTMRKCILASVIAYGVLPTEIPTAGIRNISAQDVAWYQKQERVCRLIAHCDGKAACVEPSILPRTSQEASILENVNLARYEGEQVGRFAFIGQGAGRFPTAGNVLRDIQHIQDGSMLDRIEKKPADCTGLLRRYYVRLNGECPVAARVLWQQDGQTAYLTEAVSVQAMHEMMKQHPDAFFAGWSEE